MGYKLTLSRIKDDVVIDKVAGIADARIKIDHSHCGVPQYTPSIQQQGILSKQFLSKTPIELRYIERFVSMKEVNNQNLWIFELGSQETVNVPLWIKLAFQQRDRQGSQNLNNDTFCRLPVTSAQSIFGAERYPDAAILLNYDVDDYSQACAQTKEAFKFLTKDNILQPNTSDFDFRSSNVGIDDNGYNLDIFDIRYQQNFTAPQPIKVEIEGVVPNDVNGYVLVLPNKLVSISSDGQIYFDLIQA